MTTPAGWPQRRTAAVAGLAASAVLVAGCGAAVPPRGPDSPAVRSAALASSGALREPPTLRSRNGILRATLPVQRRRVRVAGTRAWAKVYRESFPGPTLRVHPGDTVDLHVVNELGEPTNLHEHGLHVSPLGLSDNVLRTLPAHGSGEVRVQIPRTAPPGTYWYHPHVHGLAEEQSFTGLSGAIVVTGLGERMPPALRTIPDHLIALKDVQVRHGAIIDHDIDSQAPTTRTVDGQVDPVLPVRTGATHLLRLVNMSADLWYRLRLDGARFGVVAEDANPVGRVWRARTLLLPPGKRYDVLVRWPRAGSYGLRTERMSTGPAGDTYPAARLMRFRVGGAPAAPIAWPRSLAPLPALARAPVDRLRHITFTEDERHDRFMINGRQFAATRVDEVVRLGATEEWVLRNRSREEHPFHLHTDEFQVVAINGRPYDARSLQDTVVIPVGGTVRIRVRFSDFTGAFVFHCHILAHEDAGMMGLVDVTRDGRRPSARTLHDLQAMHESMMMDSR
jgi:FtsP/CotA-like multicopper oxidase with cupredoxin domain